MFLARRCQPHVGSGKRVRHCVHTLLTSPKHVVTVPDTGPVNAEGADIRLPITRPMQISTYFNSARRELYIKVVQFCIRRLRRQNGQHFVTMEVPDTMQCTLPILKIKFGPAIYQVVRNQIEGIMLSPELASTDNLSK